MRDTLYMYLTNCNWFVENDLSIQDVNATQHTFVHLGKPIMPGNWKQKSTRGSPDFLEAAG